MSDTWPNNPDARCLHCGNPRHSLPAVIKGWLCWQLVVRWWPVRWGVPPLLAHAGDWIFDERGCDHKARAAQGEQL
jgi:hypothetical protein